MAPGRGFEPRTLRLTDRCSPFGNGGSNSLSAAECRQITPLAPGVAVRPAPWPDLANARLPAVLRLGPGHRLVRRAPQSEPRRSPRQTDWSDLGRFACGDEDREVLEARLFDGVVQAVDVVPNERLTGEQRLEAGGDFPHQCRRFVESQEVTDEYPPVGTCHVCKPSCREREVIEVGVLELRIDRPRVDGVAAEQQAVGLVE